MDLKARHEELLIKREKARQSLRRAKEALGVGSWHEDSSYELADQDVRLYSKYLEDLEKQIEEIEKKLKENRGPEV